VTKAWTKAGKFGAAKPKNSVRRIPLTAEFVPVVGGSRGAPVAYAF
jgi:hypothetical protein